MRHDILSIDELGLIRSVEKEMKLVFGMLSDHPTKDAVCKPTDSFKLVLQKKARIYGNFQGM